jgi:hypothetical protein
MDSGFERANVIREIRELRYIFADGIDCQAIAWAKDLANEAGGGFLFESDFFVGTETGVDHQG